MVSKVSLVDMPEGGLATRIDSKRRDPRVCFLGYIHHTCAFGFGVSGIRFRV